MPYSSFIIYPTKTVAPVTSLWRHVFRRVFSCLDSRVVHEKKKKKRKCCRTVFAHVQAQ